MTFISCFFISSPSCFCEAGCFSSLKPCQLCPLTSFSPSVSHLVIFIPTRIFPAFFFIPSLFGFSSLVTPVMVRVHKRLPSLPRLSHNLQQPHALINVSLSVLCEPASDTIKNGSTCTSINEACSNAENHSLSSICLELSESVMKVWMWSE